MSAAEACPARDGVPGDPHSYEDGYCVFCGDHEVFGPVIFRYTDQEAIDDGVFVALTSHDRVTTNALRAITRAVEDQREPPACWPVDLMAFIGAKDADAKAMAMVTGLILTTGQIVARSRGYRALHAVRGATGFRELVEDEPKDAATYLTLLLVANEVGGCTLMLTEDN